MTRYIFMGILAALFWMGCSKSNDDDSNPINVQLGNGTWVVSYFWDKDKEETSDFNGYSFEFQDNGLLLAYLPDGTTKTGQWTVNNSSNKLILTIAGTYALDEMSDDWLIMQKTNTEIKLQDDNTSHLEALHLRRL
ncbi:MAG: hypothetical protein EP344_05265 [Bacteroidetes bacterium]|nr:MAG: hypothetical protein EP344_05265 [Bacteroidota bacterium]